MGEENTVFVVTPVSETQAMTTVPTYLYLDIYNVVVAVERNVQWQVV